MLDLRLSSDQSLSIETPSGDVDPSFAKSVAEESKR